METSRRWLERRKRVVKETTWQTYALIVEKYLMEALGEKDEITDEDIQDLVAIKDEEGFSRSTIMLTVNLAKQICRWGSRRGMIRSNPSEWVVEYPKERYGKPQNLLNRQDHLKLLSYLKGKADSGTVGILISLCTGLRIGEVCALRWEDIDLEKRRLKVRESVKRMYDPFKCESCVETGSPKSVSSERTVPVGEDLYGVLKALPHDDETLFVAGGKDTPCDPCTLRNRFRTVLHRLRIPRISFHGLRHTFATRIIESGSNVKTVSCMLGHSDVRFTMNRYVHPGLEGMQKTMQKYEEYINYK